LTPLIQLEQVSFSYGTQAALTDIALSVQEGDFLAVVGPNSSGKSTLLKLMNRARIPARGTVRLMGKPLRDWALRDIARRVAVVSSEEYFPFPFSVREVVSMGRTPYLSRVGRESAMDREVIDQSMRRADVSHLSDRLIQKLSSGERQRVLLARALSQEPVLLLLDEPSAHLDIGHEWSLFDLLARLHRDQKLTVVCALHDLCLASRYADRLMLLREGRDVAQGAPRDILTESRVHDVFGIDSRIQFDPSGGVQITPLTERTRS